MSYQNSRMERRLALLNNVKDGKFPWQEFNEIFPYALLDESEGEFDSVLRNASELCANAYENKKLLDLVDLQLVATLEQRDAQKYFLPPDNDETWDELCFDLERLCAKVQCVENLRARARPRPDFDPEKPSFHFVSSNSHTTTRQVIFKPRGSIIDRLHTEFRTRTSSAANKK